MVEYTVQVGHRRGTKKIFKDGQSGVFDAHARRLITEAVAEVNTIKTRRVSDRLLENLANAIRTAGNREMNKIMPFVMKHMMTIDSGPWQNANINAVEMYDDAAQEIVRAPTLSSRLRMGRKDSEDPLFSETQNRLSAHQLTWKSLSSWHEKKKAGKSTKFFVRDGQLYSSLQRLSGSGDAVSPMVRALGGVEVDIQRAVVTPAKVETSKERAARTGEKLAKKHTVAATQKLETHIGQLRVSIAPKVTNQLLPGLSGVASGKFRVFDADWTRANRTMGFERKLGLSNSAIKKLRGYMRPGFNSDEYYRPLLQPVAQFWLLFRVPRTVASAIRKSATMSSKADLAAESKLGIQI